jgi:hypothetical protein
MLKFKEFVDFINEKLVLEDNNFNGNFDSVVKKHAAFKDAFNRVFPNLGGSVNSKSKEAIRANFGNEEVAEENIKELFNELGYQVQEIKFHPKKSLRSKTLGSDDYDTYEIITTDQQIYFVTNRNDEVGKKDLIPSKMGIEGPYINAEQFVEYLVRSIEANSQISEETREFLIFLVRKTTETKFKNKFPDMAKFYDVVDHQETINFGKDWEIDDKILRNIVNDFGEVLDGVYLSTIIKDLGTGLYFPVAGNELLQDLVVDEWSVSSKAEKGGGRPSIAGLINKCVVFEKERIKRGLPQDSDPELQELMNIMLRLNEKDVMRGSKLDAVKGYTVFAQKFHQNGTIPPDGCYSRLLKAGEKYKIHNFGNSEKNPATREQIVELMVSMAKDRTWDSWLKDYMASGDGTTAKKDIPKSEDIIKQASKYIGFIMYPLSKEIVKILNTTYEKKMTELANKVLTVKQVYLSIDITKDTISYKAVSSSSVKRVDFVYRGSSTTFNQGLGFALVK